MSVTATVMLLHAQMAQQAAQVQAKAQAALQELQEVVQQQLAGKAVTRSLFCCG